MKFIKSKLQNSSLVLNKKKKITDRINRITQCFFYIDLIHRGGQAMDKVQVCKG